MKNLFLFAIFITVAAHGSTGIIRAKVLNERFYKKHDVCEDARRSDPSKNLALILLTTHLCDAGTHVCLDTLQTTTDEANVFVRRNFVVYQTRFYSFDLDKSGDINRLYFAGERRIRNEWNKRDLNPEVAVMDLRSCQVLGRAYVMNYPGAFSPKFITRYLALRRLILNIPGVAAVLADKAKAPSAVQDEIAEIAKLRGTGEPEQTRPQAYESLIDESRKAGLQVVRKELFTSGVESVSEFINALRRRFNDPTLDLFITTSGRYLH
jgi:hypothetical protein